MKKGIRKVIYMAQSVNGFIARLDNSTNWSTEEWRAFKEFAQNFQNVVIGRKTFELMLEEDGLTTFDGLCIFVISKEKFETDKNIQIVENIEKLINILESKEAVNLLIAGGTTLNTSFLNLNMVDELVLDIEPKVFTEGIPLFVKMESEKDLELLGYKKVGNNTLQVHYKITN